MKRLYLTRREYDDLLEKQAANAASQAVRNLIGSSPNIRHPTPSSPASPIH
jgi:hypothetical protein